MSDKSRKQQRSGFTLLELVVVLAILAVVTTLAIRSLDGLEDQSRYEKNVREFEALSAAVLGSPDDRAADGSRTVSGFVADMGRLPRAVADGNGNLTLEELWKQGTNLKFDVRQAVADNLLGSAFVDPQVYVPCGWRGPYLRLPIDATTWRDGWGNPMFSPAAGAADPNGAGYARLRKSETEPIAGGEEIRLVRHLGTNGRFDPLDTGYNRDGSLSFDESVVEASLIVQVNVIQQVPTPIPSTDTVTVHVFSPHPTNSGKIIVSPSTPPQPPLSGNSQTNTITGLTAGPRVVRAYLNLSGTTASHKSLVKNITLRPGANFVNLTIDR